MPVAAKHAAPTKSGPKRKRARGRARTDVSSSESSSDDSSSSEASSDSDSDAEVPRGDVEMAVRTTGEERWGGTVLMVIGCGCPERG